MKAEGRKMKADQNPALLVDLAKVEEVRLIEEAGRK
jgi:hypothetical protein